MSIVVTPIPRMIDLTAPAFTLGTANAAGDAITAVASDSTLLAFDTTDPDAITFGQSGSVGSATTTSRRDHAHAMAALAVPLTAIDIDGGTDIGAAIVDADLFIVDDNASGTNRKTTASRLKTYLSANGFARIKTGNYTGDGAADRDITGVTFDPKFVMITYQLTVRDGEARGISWTYDSISGGQSVMLDSTTYGYSMAAYLIKALITDGFTISDDGADTHPNKNEQAYNYLAIG